MQQAVLEFIFLPITIGGIVFLLQQTDFVYEYLSLATDYFGKNKAKEKLKLEEYKESGIYANYIQHIAGTNQAKSGLRPFLLKLISCFICLNCFISLACTILITKEIYFFIPCFFISIVTYCIFLLVKNKINNNVN